MNDPAVLILRLVIAGIFLFAGGAKLAGSSSVREMFERLELSPRTMYVVGAAEVLGAAGLLYAPTALWAALGLALIMLGALGAHMRARDSLLHTFPPIPILMAIVFLIYLLRASA